MYRTRSGSNDKHQRIFNDEGKRRKARLPYCQKRTDRPAATDFPDAETLVAKTENCREFGYDVMANLADDGNTGMLKKILSAYFSENTEENNALKRRFLLSHRINGTPKDFHHFIRFLSPREQEQAKFEQMKCSDIDEIVFQQEKLKRGVFPPDLRSKKTADGRNFIICCVTNIKTACR